jgi:23S rRNA (adenine2503-C2)-methyltransferase
VSTSSFPDRIRELADADVSCSLALSLNAPNDEKRRVLMPKASRFTIEELLDAARYFVRSGRRRVTLEYVLIPDLNMGEEDAAQLGRLTHRQPFKLNLIPYNPGRNRSVPEADGGSHRPVRVAPSACRAGGHRAAQPRNRHRCRVRPAVECITE